MMKKISYVIFAVMLLIPTLFVPKEIVYAKTLGDLKKELEKYTAEYNENKNKQKITEQEIETTKQTIMNISREIDQIGLDIITLNKEIEELNITISEKNVEIKELMNFVQISNGESAYLEYAFGAQTFTDFIYRVAISEQLANYNKNLVDEYNKIIDQNNNKTTELAGKTVSLKNKQDSLGTSLSKLNSNMVHLEESSISIEDEIASRKAAINMYQNQYGCKDNEDIETCGRNILPPDTAFYRPLVSGYVTANYGYYSPFGYQTFHYGLDFATTDNNTPVYSAASGLVISTVYGQSCGNNIVYIQHNINGKKYTTSYWHLRSIAVKVGDRVTKDTKIGIMGGAASDRDTCSTGAHVHFVVAEGLYLSDYQEQWQFNARRINPRIVLNAPAVHVYFANRHTKY